MAEPLVSLIVPLWNGAAWIRPCLAALTQSLAAAQVSGEILVVDDGSTDEGPALVAQTFPQATLLPAQGNLGFPGACNRGLGRAQGRVLVLVNQDTQVDPAWLAGLLDALTDPHVGVAGGLALFPDRRTVQHAGGVLDWPLGVARHRGYGEPLAPEHRRPAQVDFVSGAGLALRRDVLERVGLLDEGFAPGYYEDVDLCWRVREAGYSIRYAPDAILIHVESGSFQTTGLAAWARLRGRLRFVLKHLPREEVLARFLPAEVHYRSVAVPADQEGQVAQAYLEALAMALECGWTQARPEELLALTLGLHGLYRPSRPRPQTSTGEAVLEQARQPVLTPSRLDHTPGVGPLWRRLRGALHRLVLFYVWRRETALAARVRELEARLASRGPD